MKPVCLAMLSFALMPIALPAQAQTSDSNGPPQKPWLASPYAIPAADATLPGVGPIRRADWFQQLWVQRRTDWSGQIAQDQGALVFLGDSIIQQWGDRMGGSFPGVKVANRGISGDTSRGMLIRLKEDVLTLHPSAVVLLLGCDDLDAGGEPQSIADNLKLILAGIKTSYPSTPLILCQTLPSATSAKRPAAVIQKINQLLAVAVKGDKQVTLVETWKLFANTRGDANPAEIPDRIHPNKAGYAKLAAALHPLLATLGLMDTAPDDFAPEPGFTNLFNGRDLAGWGYVTNNFSAKTYSPDGHFLARNGRLVATTPPGDTQQPTLWTTRQIPDNFTLRFEFRATPDAAGAISIRGTPIPCGDYPLAGPYKKLTKFKPLDWNQIEITVTNNTARCACNGESLELSLSIPATGAIGMKAGPGQIEYRRIRIQESP